MKQTKKAASFSFVLLLILSLLVTACSGGTATTEKEPAAETPAATDKPSEPEKPAVPEEHVTLKMFTPPGSGIPNSNEEKLVEEEINKYLKDKINASIDLNFLDWGPWFEKIPVMLASGEEMDILFTAGWSGFGGNVEKGAFIPLEDLIDQYAPNTKAMLNPIYWEGAKKDDSIYAIPANKEVAEQKGFALRKDLVEKYNMDVSNVKTIEELEPFFEIIKQNEKEIVAYGTMNANGPWSSVIKPGGDEVLVDGKFVNIFKQEQYTKLYKLAHKWFKAGYINQDAATAQDIEARVKAGKVFGFEIPTKPGKAEEMKNSNGYDWVIVELGAPVITNDSIRGSMMAIPHTAKHPERSMMFLELLNTDPVVNNLVNFGIEGKHYTKVSENIIKEIPNSGYKPNAGWMFGNQFINYIWENEDPNKWETYREFNEKAEASPILGFDFNGDAVKNERAAIGNLKDQYMIGLATGALNPDEILPVLIEKIEGAGLDKVLEEKNKQFAEWKSKQ